MRVEEVARKGRRKRKRGERGGGKRIII